MGSRDGFLLLVEDEPLVRKVIKTYLERQGFLVKDASSGEDALDIVVREGSAMSFLLTDIVMPGMSGRELASRTRGLLPTLPILFITGYSDEMSDTPNDIPYLSKPIDFDLLLRQIESMLRAGSQGTAGK